MRASKQLNCCDIFKETLGDAEIDCFFDFGSQLDMPLSMLFTSYMSPTDSVDRCLDICQIVHHSLSHSSCPCWGASGHCFIHGWFRRLKCPGCGWANWSGEDAFLHFNYIIQSCKRTFEFTAGPKNFYWSVKVYPVPQAWKLWGQK